VSQDFLLLVFFHESVSPQPQSIPKICGDIRKSRCTTSINDTGGKFATGVAAKLPPLSTTPAANLPPLSTTPGANFATGFAGVVYTGSKFATGVNNTLSCEYIREFSKKFKMALMVYSGAWRKLIY
jgi:hypothetical protein